LPGGFVGVDIFFVISGYLITQLILIDLNKGEFSAASFYARRIRRIFPALIIVLIVTFLLGWHYLLPPELMSLGKNIFASALFSANLMLLSEVGYFDVDAHLKPLLHLWSLGIEEQFYLVWPWLLWAVPRAWLTPVMILAIAASFALDVSMVEHHPSQVFYLPLTRAWELLAGGVLVRFARTKEADNDLLAIAGIVAIECSFFFIDAHTVFPGWATVVPVGGTMLLLQSEGSFVNRFVFSNRLAVNVGLISYPLYLWHWPLLVFAEIFKFKRLTDLERGLVVVVTFLLAWLTYKLSSGRSDLDADPSSASYVPACRHWRSSLWYPRSAMDRRSPSPSFASSHCPMRQPDCAAMSACSRMGIQTTFLRHVSTGNARLSWYGAIRRPPRSSRDFENSSRRRISEWLNSR
jgi:peptidoglycan/LPS O-acetylase OafA/YrhL